MFCSMVTSRFPDVTPLPCVKNVSVTAGALKNQMWKIGGIGDNWIRP